MKVDRAKLEKILLFRAHPPHKWTALFPDGRKVSFGLAGFQDYTLHKDPERMHRYIIRHQKRENWTETGKYTRGFWSRWLLWSHDSLRAAIRETERALGHRYKIVLQQ